MICNKTNSDIDWRTLEDSPMHIAYDTMDPKERHTIPITSSRWVPHHNMRFILLG